MAENSDESLKTYKIHLEQVEAALLATPESEELLKLKADLEEVIALTVNLTEPSTSTESEDHNKEPPAAAASSSTASSHKWNVGDECLAQWSQDGQWYKAHVDAITSDGMVAVTYEEYGSSDVTKLTSLRELSEADTLMGQRANQQKGPKKRQLQEAQRQQLKKKKQKKFDRQKQIEEAHEQDKMKWQQFNTKNKKMKGVTKKSIFASPDAVNGRVGIGTCGIGGRPMTDFTHAEKRKKGV